MQSILIGLDLEATDKKVMEAEITQIGLCFYLVGPGTLITELEGFQSFVHCKKKICEEASIVTGICDKDLIGAPCFNEVMDIATNHFVTVCEPYPTIDRTLVAFNGKKFDVPLLVYELYRNGKDPIAFLKNWKINKFFDPFHACKNVLDTTLLQKNARGQPSYKLECVYEALFKKPLENAHSALADANAMIHLVLVHLRDPLVDEKFLNNLLTLVRTIKVKTTTTAKVKMGNTLRLESQCKKARLEIHV